MTFAPGEYFEGARPIRLGPRIGKGGEGEVFALEGDAARAVKLYHPARASEREAKIAAMVRSRLATAAPSVAFPLAIVRTNVHRFAGFIMPRVFEAKPLHDLYAPGPRKIHFPEADYRFLVRAALNAARAVAAVHQTGCVIGDVNHSSFLISKEALVALIDADSFQFVDGATRHLCRVGVPEYTAPELLGRPLDGVIRTPDHDGFGLAVALFQLLFMGRHPFSGVSSRGDVPTMDAIRDHRFVYSRSRRTNLAPPPGTARLEDFPSGLGDLFERAFAPAGLRGRPSAASWVEALSALERDLRVCAAEPQHRYPRAADDCPWCRIESGSAAPLFIPPILAAGSDGRLARLPPYDKAQALAALRTIETPDHFAYSPPSPAGPSMAPPPRRSRLDARLRQAGGFLMIAVALTLIALAPPAWIMGLPLVVAGAVAIRNNAAPDRPARRELEEVDRHLQRARAQIQEGVDIDAAWILKAEIERLIAARADLAVELAAHGSQLRAKRVEAAQRQALERYRLRDAKIRGIGPALIAALASCGFMTAADVLRGEVSRAPGIGLMKASALRDWARGLAARVQVDGRPSAAEQADLARKGGEAAARARDLETRISREMQRLRALSGAIKSAGFARDAGVEDLLRRRASLVKEIELLGGTPPPAPNVSPRRLRDETIRQASAIRGGAPPAATRRTTGGPLCPLCGAGMVQRTARRGRNSGGRFWECASYPACRGTRP